MSAPFPKFVVRRGRKPRALGLLVSLADPPDC